MLMVLNDRCRYPMAKTELLVRQAVGGLVASGADK